MCSTWRPGPVTSIVRQVNFFMASAGITHGPPVELQPGADATAVSIPFASASSMAYRKAAFQPGEPYGMVSATMGFMPIPPASNWWKPPIPARSIHSISFWIPSMVTFPSIQCHHTRGRASCGGSANPSYSGPCACAPTTASRAASTEVHLFIGKRPYSVNFLPEPQACPTTSPMAR